MPLRVGGQVIGATALGFVAAGLGYLVDPDRPTRGVTELLLANGTAVGTGEIDVERADENLRAGEPDLPFEIPFEAVGERGAFTVYEPVTDREGAAAVGESAVLAADSRAAVRRVVDAHRGEHARAVDESGTFDWLVDTAGTGHVLVGWDGPVDLGDYYFGTPDDSGATGFAAGRNALLSSLTFAPGSEEITARLALADPGLDGETRDRLAARLGAASTSGTVSGDGGGDDRLTATGTYTDDALDVEFVAPDTDTATDATGRTGGGTATGTLPPEVATAVPDEGFEFTYDEDDRRVQVALPAGLEADEVTVSVVDAYSERSTTTPDVVDTLSVYLEAGNGVVVVVVTVDGVSATVAREEFP